MDLRRLEVFAKVYERKSFSRAAEEVLLSQPTVSGHIKSLEEELGVRLFDRLGREILPTQAAEVLFGYAQRILQLVKEASRAVNGYLGRLSGELALGGSTIPGQYVLPGLIGHFKALHPEVLIKLEVSGTGQIVDQVLKGKLEAGLVGAVVADDRLLFNSVMDDVLVVAAWPDHPQAHKTISAKELVQLPFIMREPASGTRMALSRALNRLGLSAQGLNVVAQIRSTVAVLQAVKAQVGVGVVSRRALAEDLAAGRLAEITVGDLDLHRHFHLVTRKGRTMSPAAQAFIALCMAGLQEAA